MELKESDNLAERLLPRKTSQTLQIPYNANPVKFYSNIFEIKLKKDKGEIYQYSLDISPQLQADSVRMIAKILKTITPQLKKAIGFLQGRGMMVWGTKEMKTVLTCKADFSLNQKEFSFEVFVKPVKIQSLQAYMTSNLENIPSISQVLNINAKKRLRQKNMIQLSRGSYFLSETINNNTVEGKLNVWRGYNVTVATYNRKLYLQVDPCSRILRVESFLDTINEQKRKLAFKEINAKYKGFSLLRRYGNPQIFKIEQIDFQKSPKSTFYWQKQGMEVSYIQYFKRQYGVIIKYENQALVKVSNKQTKKIKKQDSSQFIYLVPQLVCLTGLTDQQRSNFKLMKNLAEYTKLSAQRRISQTRRVMKELQSNQLLFNINENPECLNGFKLPTPAITFSENKLAEVKKGEFQIKQIISPFKFQNIIFSYSLGRDVSKDRIQADQAYQLLQKATKRYGILLPREPIFIEVNRGDKLQDWTRQLLLQKQKFREDQNIDIVVFFLNTQEKNMYSSLKKFINKQFQIPSQVITKRVLTSQKSQMAAAGRIVLQMNTKVGRSLWNVLNKNPHLSKQSIAVAGIANSFGKNGATLAFSGTTNTDLTNYHSESRLIKKKEDFSLLLFKNMFVKWIQNYYKKNSGTLPTLLVVYREGFNEVQAKIQSQCQVKGIIEAIEYVRIKTNKNNYNPKVQYVLVNKKPNSRIYQGNGKYDFNNPQPGSIIFEGLSQGEKGFHLVSTSVREGTCTPVSYKILYENTPNFPLEAISELTYNQTYAYFNWNGSVRVPAALQYANKLAKQFSDIGDELGDANSEIKSKLFFL